MPRPSLATTQSTVISIMTATRTADFDTANKLVREYQTRYGTVLPLAIGFASFANSVLDAYAEIIEEEPDIVLQALALQTLEQGENT